MFEGSSLSYLSQSKIQANNENEIKDLTKIATGQLMRIGGGEVSHDSTIVEQKSPLQIKKKSALEKI